MSLLMRTFWGAYVGHCMDKHTFTTLLPRFTRGAAFLLFTLSDFPFPRRLSHSTLKETRARMKTEQHCPTAQVYERGPVLTSF